MDIAHRPPSPSAPPCSRAPQWSSPRHDLERTLHELSRRPNLLLLRAAHARLLRLHLHCHPSLPPLLVSSYSLCRRLPYALASFRLSPLPTPRLFNSLIRALADHSLPSPALRALSHMLSLGISPDPFTFPSVLRSHPPLPHLRMIHSHILKSGFFSSDPFVPNSLMDAYSRCGPIGIASARKVFDGMPHRDVVSWNTMVAGLLRCGELSGAREVFDEMPERDVVSWNTMIDGYAKAGEMDQAFRLLDGMPERNVVSWSTVVSGYCKIGDVEMARVLFDKMPVRNLVTWTIMVSGYAKKGLANEAEVLLGRMMVQPNLKVDNAAMISILAACAESGLFGLGRKVHDWIQAVGLGRNIQVCNAVIDMYAKCGYLNEAMGVFEMMDHRDRVSWNSIIHCLAVHGHGERALGLFSMMKLAGIQPDGVTFVSILCACTHAGLLKEGRYYFDSMSRDYGISPQIEHYGCMVDLLGRGGLLCEAFKLICTMPFEPSTIIYGSFLNACRMHNNVYLAEAVLDKVLELDSSDPGVYAIMSNIYATSKHWDGMAKLRLRMKYAGVQKPSGSSYVEVGNVVHEFTVADKSHPKTRRILQMLDSLGSYLKCDTLALDAQVMVS